LASYFKHQLTPAGNKAAVNRVLKTIKRLDLKPDAILIRGMSSAIVGPIVAHHLGVRLLISRKNTDNFHGRYSKDGIDTPYPRLKQKLKVLFVDDFTDTGDTIQAAKDSALNAGHEWLGTALYGQLNREGREDFICG